MCLSDCTEMHVRQYAAGKHRLLVHGLRARTCGGHVVVSAFCNNERFPSAGISNSDDVGRRIGRMSWKSCTC